MARAATREIALERVLAPRDLEIIRHCRIAQVANQQDHLRACVFAAVVIDGLGRHAMRRAVVLGDDARHAGVTAIMIIELSRGQFGRCPKCSASNWPSITRTHVRPTFGKDSR